MFFSISPYYISLERMMTSVPRFPPRGHGVYIYNRINYSEKDCCCLICQHHSRNKGCKITRCECIEKRIEEANLDFAEFLKHTFTSIKHPLFQSRLTQYITESEEHPMPYRGKAHREMYCSAIERSLNSGNALLSALYLLTADKYLWWKVRCFVNGSAIDFSSIRLGNASPEVYTLYMTARDLYEGTKHITVSDLADRSIVPDIIFGILVNAMSIRRYGMKAVQIIDKGGDSE